jgi:hypothetical protein
LTFALLAMAFAVVPVSCGKLPVSPLATRAVDVSLIALAQQSPEWSSVRQLDAASHLASLPLLSAGLPRAAGVSVGSDSLLAAPAAPMSQPAVQAAVEAFAIGSDHASDQVRAHLDRSQARLIKIAQDASAVRVAAGVDAARTEATSEYLEQLRSLLAQSLANRTNLEIQVMALSADASPTSPVTAPDDYWGKLLSQKSAELASLPEPQALADSWARQSIDQRVESARQNLQAAADADLSAYELSLDANRQRVIQRQADALAQEKAELLAATAQLNQGANATSAPDAAAVELSKPSAPIDATSYAVPAQFGNSAAAERDRLVREILDGTERRAERAAAELGLSIASWTEPKPDANVMSALERQMRLDRAI